MNQRDPHIDPDVVLFRGEVEAFIASSGISPSRFGREARNDSRFVADMRNGRIIEFQTRSEVRSWMDRWREENAAGPTGDPALPGDVSDAAESERAA